MKNPKVAHGMNRFRKEIMKLFELHVPRHLKNNYKKMHHKSMIRKSKFNRIKIYFDEY